MYLQTAMELMGIVGIIVNCALIGQSGQVHRMFPNITSTQTIILVVILEVSYNSSIQICIYGYLINNFFLSLLIIYSKYFQHIMILLKVAIAYAIPDTPVWVETEMAKIEYRRRETEKNLSISHMMAGASSMISRYAQSLTIKMCNSKKMKLYILHGSYVHFL